MEEFKTLTKEDHVRENTTMWVGDMWTNKEGVSASLSKLFDELIVNIFDELSRGRWITEVQIIHDGDKFCFINDGHLLQPDDDILAWLDK